MNTRRDAAEGAPNRNPDGSPGQRFDYHDRGNYLATVELATGPRRN